jgi:inorganic pyrophosphatase
VYKQLEDKPTATEGYYGAEEAANTIRECMAAWTQAQRAKHPF